MGRSREFDREKAIEAALGAFWHNGYERTSLEELLKCMGIKNSSFYQAFKSKEDLFIEVLQWYRQNVASERLDYLKSDQLSLRQALQNYYKHLIYTHPRKGYPIGCFMTNTAASLPDPDSSIGKQVQLSITNIEGHFISAMKRAQASGEISKNLKINEIARVLITTSYGLTVIARAKKNKKELLNTAFSVIDLVVFKS